MKKISFLPLAVSIAALIAPAHADSSKANNTTALNLAGSWTNGIIPGAGDIAIWDSNFSAAVVASQSQLGADTTWLGIKVTNVSGPINTTNTGAAILNAGSAQTLTIGSAGIDMSAATQAFLIQSKVTIGADQTWNIANANTQVSTFTALNNADDLGFFAQAAGAAFNLGGNTVTTTGAGGISFSSGYTISNGTFNIGNPLFEIQGGTSRLTTVASSVTLNVPTGSILHFQSTSGAVTSDAAINLNGGTLKFVSNNSGVNVTVNGTVAVNNPSTINVGLNAANGAGANGAGTLNLNANLTGSAPLNVTNTTTAASGVGTWSRLLVGGNNSGYSGTITLGAAGSTAGKVTRLVNANSGSAAATWSVAANHTLEVNGVTVNLGTLTGAGAINSSAGASTLNVGAGDFSGSILDGAGTMALTKNGNGVLLLTGFNSYSGATTVNRGTLLVTPNALLFTPINVNDGGTFAVQSTISAGINGSVTVNAGGTASVRQQAPGVTISMPSLTTTNGTVNIDTGTFGNPVSAPLSLLVFDPVATTIRVSGSSLTIANGIPLISYSGGVIGGGGFGALSLSLPTRTVGVLVNNTAASTVDLNITSFEQIKWRGNLSGNWDVDPDGTGATGTLNWLTTSSAVATRFLQGTGGTDTANFDDTASTGGVNLTTVLTPGGVIVNNNTLAYTFSGPGRISGAASLTKTGTGILTIANTAAYDYSGGTTIGVGGALRLGDGTTPGAGVIGGAINVNGTLILNRPDDHVFANAIFGTGKLQKDQANTVTINSNPVLNDVAINAGTLRFDAGGTVTGLLSGTGVLSVAGGTLLLAGTGNSTFISIANISAGTLQLNNTGGNAIGGTINISGTGGLTLSQANQIEDSTVINYNKAANGGNIIIGNETFAALNMANGADAGGQVQANNGFAVTGLITAQNTSVFAVASNHSGSAGGLNVNGAAVIRIAANGGPSTLNVGAQGIAASGGTIQVGQGTGAFDAILNLEGNVVATGNFAFTDGGFVGAPKREINLGVGNHTFDIASGTTTTVAPDIAGVGGITKLGNGTLQLTAASASTYTGPTTITAGTFLTNTSQIAGPINVGGGATIGVNILAPGTTLTATSLDTAANSTVILDARALGNPTTPVISAPALNINGATTLRLTGGNFANGTAIPLIDYTGTIGGLGFAGLNIVLPLRVSGTLVDNTIDTRVDLTILGLEYPKWNGNVNSNWDIDPDGTGATGTANWLTSITNSPTRYFQGPAGTDTVTFDDTAAGSTVVSLTTLLTPVGAIVNNASKAFTFAGGGRLTGNAVLTKSGTGTLILANTVAYDHTGGTTLNEGTLQIGDGTTAGAGLLPAGLTTNNATITLNRPDIATMGGAITGPGTLIKVGAGTVTLTGALTYTGTTLVSAGTLGLNSTSTLAGPVTIAQGATLRLDNATGTITSTIANNGIVNLNTTLSLNTTIEGTGGLLVNTAGARALGGFTPNTFTGLTTVSAGNLTLNKTDGISGLPAIGGDVLINGTGVITVGALGNQFADTSSITVEQGGQLLSTESAAALKPDIVANITINAATPVSTTSGMNITGTLRVTAGAQHDLVNSGGMTSANTALFSNTSVRLGINAANSILNIGTGGVTLVNATILYGSAGVATFLGSVNLDGNVTGSGTSAFDVNTGNPMSRIDLGAASRTFNIIDGTTTIEPSIISATPTSGIIKSGNGTLLLAAGTNTNGISTYPGDTLIDAGTLLVQGVINGTAAVKVSGSGTLAGTGSISPAPAGNVSLLSGGRISPGSGPGFSVGTLSLTLSGGGALDLTAGIAAPNSQSLRFDLNNLFTGDVVFTTGGALKIGDGLLEFNDFVFNAPAGVSTEQDFILFDGDTPIEGTFGPNISGPIGVFTGELRMANGNTDIIVHIPEPTGACLFLTAFAMLGAHRRRRASRASNG